ncbi:hypothetical protein [Phyllobacterium leguminum]|uniref:Uncharacterized protein n=1 Tax=Phyllobacterium leguminum TaxID=314237 RepID=A0A318TFX6_9HYPH|nr:hypothetical protein [Phyllobacterium leguminum]PYE90592.1 hypothetical protein C7477_101266 [Phyllobacterium leguminum]
MSTTATFLPDPTNPLTKLYQGQKLLVTVNLTSTTPLSNGMFVRLINLGGGFLYDQSAAQPNYANPRPITVNPNDNKTAYVEFVLDVVPNAPTNSATNLTFTAYSDSPGIGLPRTTANYKILAPRINPTFVGPTPGTVPIPPTTLPTPLTPAEGPGYTVFVSTTMTDDTNTPVQYCVIDWDQYVPVVPKLYTTEVYTYLNSTDTVPIQDNPRFYWPNGPLSYGPDGHQFIRTITGSDGVARLYLVGDNQNPQGGAASGNIQTWNWYDFASGAGPFSVG